MPGPPILSRFFVVEEERWPWPQTTCRSPRRHTAAERLLGLETLLHAPAPLAVTAAPRPLANIILEHDAIFPPYSVPHLSRFSIHQTSFLEIDLHNTGFLLGGGPGTGKFWKNHFSGAQRPNRESPAEAGRRFQGSKRGDSYRSDRSRAWPPRRGLRKGAGFEDDRSVRDHRRTW